MGSSFHLDDTDIECGNEEIKDDGEEPTASALVDVVCHQPVQCVQCILTNRG